jgi:DNA-binding transcriptional LysR family regulator
MDLTQIRYFLVLAQTLNFTRAAEACHITQPALTKSISGLRRSWAARFCCGSGR